MSLHEYFKNVAIQPVEALKNEIQAADMTSDRRASINRRSSIGTKPLKEFATMGLRELVDETYSDSDTGYSFTAKRFYIQSIENNEYTQVGWLLHEGVELCMICRAQFGSSKPKHNCSACGIVVCNTCSDKTCYVTELADLRKHRVCGNCFDGKEAVSAVEKFNAAPRGTFGESIITSIVLDETSSVATNGSAEGPLHHMQFLKTLTHKPYGGVKADFEKAQSGRIIVRRKSFILKSVQDVYSITHLEPETVMVGKKEATVYRVYVLSNLGGGYCEVGWVVLDGVTNCMCCSLAFGVIYSKYHCKACGDVVCSSCARATAKIAELNSTVRQRICKKCVTGEVEVHIRSKKPAPPVVEVEEPVTTADDLVTIEATPTPPVAPFCYCFA